MEHRGVIKSQEMLSRFWLSAYLEGASINFLTENRKVMVNATEMAKPFGKQVSDWLRLPSFVQFIDNLEAVRKSHRSELVNQVNGVGTLFTETWPSSLPGGWLRHSESCATTGFWN